jgi:hypothetical protein
LRGAGCFAERGVERLAFFIAGRRAGFRAALRLPPDLFAEALRAAFFGALRFAFFLATCYPLDGVTSRRLSGSAGNSSQAAAFVK